MIETRVREVMNGPARTVDPDLPIPQVASRLAGYGIGSLVVAEDDDVVGIITESDVVRIVAAGQPPSAVTVRDGMSSPVITVGPEESLDDAAGLLCDNRIKKLPVVDDDELVGIVTATDLARYMPQYRLRTVDAGEH